jgi:hypothetical protein
MATAKKPAGKKAATPVKPATKAAPKPVTRKAAGKPAAPAPAPKAAAPATATKPKAVKDDKARKPKLVRDSFTIPKAEYAVLDTLKDRAVKAGAPAKKSELLRAGIKALAAMSDAAFLAAMGAVPAIKTGRPAKA